MISDYELKDIKPLHCDNCNQKIGYIAECDNQSQIFCADCVATENLRRALTAPPQTDWIIPLLR